MRSILSVLILGLALSAAGCGKSNTTNSSSNNSNFGALEGKWKATNELCETGAAADVQKTALAQSFTLTVTGNRSTEEIPVSQTCSGTLQYELKDKTATTLKMRFLSQACAQGCTPQECSPITQADADFTVVDYKVDGKTLSVFKPGAQGSGCTRQGTEYERI